MKHFLAILLLAVTTFAFGAEKVTILTNSEEKISTTNTPTNSEYVNRKGNSYLLNGYIMNKKAFMNTLYTTCPTAYNHFNKGYKLSNVGWGLFGGGLGVATAGVLISGIGAIQSTKGQTNYGAVIGDLFIIAGSDFVTAGIVCLSIGYGKMHNSVDLYNIKLEAQQPKPTLSVNYTGTGAGIAIAW